MRVIVYFCFLFCFFSSAIEDVISLSVGLENDYSLDESFKGRALAFQGTYTRVTGLVYDKTSNTIRFSPKKTGVGTLHIKEGKNILKKYTIDVRKTDLNRVAYEIQSLLKEIDGITIKIINNKVGVDGEIFTPRDMKRIYNVIKEYPKQATSLVTLSTSAQNQLARFIEKEIGNPNITVKAVNEKFILRGTVSTPAEKSDAEIIANLYAPSVVTDAAVKSGVVRDRDIKDVIINRIIVKKPPKPEKKQNKLVQMIVHYVELDKGYADQFRFEWSPRIEDGTEFVYQKGAVNQGMMIVKATINNFLPKLNWAKEFGFARILHTSNLIVEEEKSGTVQATQNIPYGTLAGEGGTSSGNFVPVGIKGTLTPYIVGSRKDGVRLQVQMTVTNLLGVSKGAPVTSERSIQTSLYVRSGLSAAIGGVISNNSHTNYNREPLGALQSKGDPLLNLLASKNFGRNQNQFVFFVTPIIKSSASTGVEKIKRKFRLAQ